MLILVSITLRAHTHTQTWQAWCIHSPRLKNIDGTHAAHTHERTHTHSKNNQVSTSLFYFNIVADITDGN